MEILEASAILKQVLSPLQTDQSLVRLSEALNPGIHRPHVYLHDYDPVKFANQREKFIAAVDRRLPRAWSILNQRSAPDAESIPLESQVTGRLATDAADVITQLSFFFGGLYTGEEASIDNPGFMEQMNQGFADNQTFPYIEAVLKAVGLVSMEEAQEALSQGGVFVGVINPHCEVRYQIEDQGSGGPDYMAKLVLAKSLSSEAEKKIPRGVRPMKLGTAGNLSSDYPFMSGGDDLPILYVPLASISLLNLYVMGAKLAYKFNPSYGIMQSHQPFVIERTLGKYMAANQNG